MRWMAILSVLVMVGATVTALEVGWKRPGEMAQQPVTKVLDAIVKADGVYQGVMGYVEFEMLDAPRVDKALSGVRDAISAYVPEGSEDEEIAEIIGQMQYRLLEILKDAD